MPALVNLLEPAARIVVATLFNSLWEAALLALLVAAVLRLLPNVNATTRYAAWCVALAAALLLPLATALPQVNVQRQSAAHQAAPAGQTAPAVLREAAKKPAASGTLAAPKSSTPSKAVPAFRLPERLHFALPQYVALAIFAVWCLAALLLLVRLAVNLWRLERLKSDALPLPVEYRERLNRWAAAEKGEREVRLCTCEGIEVPVAVGLFDSMILIPQHLLDTLSQEEIDQIILHELAHLRRADDWTNGVQRLIQALFFFNPAVLYIAQQLDLEREVACDDWVVHQTKEVRPYATCLTKMAEATAWPHRPLAAPGVFITRRGLSVRVERLLRVGRNIRTSVSFGPTGAIVAALIVLFFVLQNVAPSFAFTLPQEQNDAAAMQKTIVLYKHDAAKAKQDAMMAKETIAQVTPAPAAAPASPHPQVRYIYVPGRHIHVPARDIRVPAVNVDVPARRIAVPSIPPASFHGPLPRDFGSRIASSTSQAVSQAMAQAFGGRGGNYNCVGCDYSGQNLSGRSFRGQRLSGADFSRADLRNADFSNSDLVGADFSRADLRGANFSHAKLTGCDFTHAQIAGVNFDGVTMVGCDVDARSLAPAQAGALLRGCRMGCDFQYADLRGQDLRNLEITGIDLSHANLRGADLSGSKLQGIDFTGAQLDGARFTNAELTGCDFTGVDLHNVDFSNAKLTGSTMNGTRR